jgi:chromate transporter
MNPVPAVSPPQAQPGSVPGPPKLTHWQIFLRFLRFGFLAWGGPVAQIAMLRRELVEEKGWISNARFNRLLAVYQVLPGPEAHELCVYLGTLPGRRIGGFLAGLGFMLPGFVLMFLLSWLYFRMDISQSALGPIFLGIQPAVIALIVRAVHHIGTHVVVDKWLWGIAIASAGASLFGVSFWIMLPVAGLLYALIQRENYALAGILTAVLTVAAVIFVTQHGIQSGLFGGAMSQETAASQFGVGVAHDASLLAVFLSGLKAGLLTFGGAYTVIPFLRDDAVGNGWMTDAEFLDGLALSGILPAPLIIFSTFVGYFAAGPLGAIVMTVGIFLPAFCFTLFLHDKLEKLVDNKAMYSFLEGVSASVVGLIAATTLELAYVVASRMPSLLPGVLIFAASLAVLYLWKAKTNVVFVVLGAGLAGWLVFGLLR